MKTSGEQARTRKVAVPLRVGAPSALAHNRPEVGLVYHVHPDLRGEGYATESARALVRFAFGPMRLARIIATTERDNLASQAVMRHLGMQMYDARAEPAWLQTVGILENTDRVASGTPLNLGSLSSRNVEADGSRSPRTSWPRGTLG